MRPHDHYPGCRFNGMRSDLAWRGHLRAALLGWLILTVVLWLMIMAGVLAFKAVT